MKERILSFLLKEKVNFWRLCPVFGYVPDLVKTLKRMRKQGLIDIQGSEITLTQKGKKEALSLGILPFSLPKGLEIKTDKDLLRKFRKLRKKIATRLDLDQYPLTAESVVKKIELMKMKGDIFRKRIICLGDDDLTGIALALTKLPKEIAVLDVDRRILDYEKKILKTLGYKPRVFFHNLLDPLPRGIKNRFDVFVTEPPDTIEGNVLFFSRGIESLKNKKGVGYIGISSNDLPKENILKIEKNILKMNALITDVLSRFEPYEPMGDEFSWVFGLPKEINLPNTSWFYSDLYRTEILEGAKPLIKKRPSAQFIKRFIKTDIYC